MKLHCIIPFVSLLASCDPVTVHVFEPRISGTPVRTSDTRARLHSAVVETAARHDLASSPKKARFTTRGVVTEESLLNYFKRLDSGSISMELYRDHASGTDKVRLIDWMRFRRSKMSKAIEREIRASLR